MKKFQLNTLMKRGIILFVLFNSAFFGCKKFTNNSTLSKTPEQISFAQMAAGNKQVHFPGDDPGAPFYSRVGNLMNQFFVTEGLLFIPFFRDPACVRSDFNLLNMFDVPAAFGCSLTVSGSYIIEKDAAPGTFPMIVQSSGSAVPVWLVRWADFQIAASDGEVTIGELQSLNPLKGTATKFHETLRPRFDNHFIQMNVSGVLQDGRSFDFHLTHVGDETKNIKLSIK